MTNNDFLGDDEMTNELNVLGNGTKTGEAGEHFTDSQTKSQVAGRVSAIWESQCMTFKEGREKLEQDQSIIRDHMEPLNAWRPVVTSKGQFALRRLKDGRDFVPTEHCLTQLAVVGKTSDWMLQDLANDKESTTKRKNNGFNRDQNDAELMVRIVDHTLFHPKRMDQKKTRLFRTWEDGTLRALLSEQYAIVNNSWYLSVLEEFIPGGLLSHWRGDADTIFGNVLIPDSIRQESDSAYGGMLSIGNSEIGIRRIMSLPSIFRAICMNGCIWEQEMGKGVHKVHRGTIELTDLKYSIKKNLEAQIPLLGDGVRQMLGTRGRGFGDCSTIQMLAALAKSFRITRKNMVGIRKAYDVETGILGKEALTAFGLLNAVTRHGQTLSDADWVKFDQLGGTIAMQKENEWNGLRALASSIKDAKEIEKLLGLAV